MASNSRPDGASITAPTPTKLTRRRRQELVQASKPSYNRRVRRCSSTPCERPRKLGRQSKRLSENPGVPPRARSAMPRRRQRDDLVGEVADALTLDQDIDWDRCRRQATPADGRSLDNLRLVAGLFSGSEAAEDASPATSLQPFGGVFARRAMQVVMAFAAVEVTAALLLLLWGWNDIRRDAFALHLAFLLVGYSVTAGLFLFGGRRDRRTRLLGAYFLLQATLANPFLVLGLLLELPPTKPFGIAAAGYPYVFPSLFAPVCLWALARECPRVHRRTRLDDLARRMVPVSLVAGCVLSVGSVAVLELTRAGHVDPALFWLGFDAVIATSILLALGAVLVVLLRAHTAPAEEARRVALIGTGFVMCTGLSALHQVIKALSPGSSLADFGWSPVLLAPQPLRFPGLALLWCSVLAVRVPHLREAVRAAYRRLLARGGLLAGAAAIPAGALAWLAATRPDHTVGSMAADPLVRSLAAAGGVLLLVSANRERLLMRLDAWIHPDTADRRQTLRLFRASARPERVREGLRGRQRPRRHRLPAGGGGHPGSGLVRIPPTGRPSRHRGAVLLRSRLRLRAARLLRRGDGGRHRPAQPDRRPPLVRLRRGAHPGVRRALRRPPRRHGDHVGERDRPANHRQLRRDRRDAGQRAGVEGLPPRRHQRPPQRAHLLRGGPRHLRRPRHVGGRGAVELRGGRQVDLSRRCGTFNASGFYMDIRNLQATLTAGTCSPRIIFNVPDARSADVELELAPSSTSRSRPASPTPGCSRRSPRPTPIEAGRRLPTTPRFQATTAATWRWLAGGGWVGYLSGIFQHVGSTKRSDWTCRFPDENLPAVDPARRYGLRRRAARLLMEAIDDLPPPEMFRLRSGSLSPHSACLGTSSTSTRSGNANTALVR